MKKIFSVALLFAVCVNIVGCSVNPSEVDDKYAKNFVKNVKYIKDEKTGICYGIVATRKTMDTDQNGISWTWVPCEQVEKFLVK